MNLYKTMASLFVACAVLLVTQTAALMGQEFPPDLGSSIKSLRDAKAYCERILREVEAGTTVLVPFEVKTADGKSMFLDDYNRLPKDQRPKILEAHRIPTEVKEIALRLEAAKVSADEQKRVIAGMVAGSKAATGTLKAQLAKIEQRLAQEPSKGGATSGKQIILQGEVVEVNGDKVRVSLKGKSQPQVGDPVKITYEIAGTDIKADVATGKVAKVEPGFASVDITKKTAEIRKGYLAELTSSATGEVAKQPPPDKGFDLTGEWTNDTPKDEPLFDGPKKNFRLEKKDPGIFLVPGFDNRAPVRIVNDELGFYSRSGSRFATGKVERDPKTGAVVRIRWSAGSTWTRTAVTDLASTGGDPLDYLPDDCVSILSFDVAVFMKSKLYQELKTQIKEFEAGFREFEHRTRFGPENLTRITIGIYDKGQEVSIINTLKPISAADLAAKMKPLLPSDRNFKLNEVKLGSFTLYQESYQIEYPDGKLSGPIKGRAFCVVEEKIVIFGELEAIKKVLQRDRKPALSRGMAAELESGLTGFTMIFDVQAMPEDDRREMERNLGRAIPGFGDVLAGVKMFAVRGSAADDVAVRATLTCKDKAGAESAQKAADTGLALFKLFFGKDDPQDPAEIKKAKKTVSDALGAIKLSVQDTQVRAEASMDAAAAIAIFRALDEMNKAEVSIDPTSTPADVARAKSAKNLRQFGVAFHGFADVNKGYLPAHAIYDKAGKKPLLSWRVAILPWFEQKALFDEFKLDEPWDSEHNKKLIPRMPKIYDCAAAPREVRDAGKTYYQVFTGKDALFNGVKSMKIFAIPDGLANTILVIEAKEPVIWTKPDDLVLPEDKNALPAVGGLFKNGFHILFGDGTVNFVTSNPSASTLRPFVTASGGENVDHNQLFGKASKPGSSDLVGEWTMVASKDTAFGSEFTSPKSFRLEKTATPDVFRNPGSSNARIEFVKDKLRFINNASNQAATAKIDADPKTGTIQRIEWSDGSVFMRMAGAVVEPKKVGPVVEPKHEADLSCRWEEAAAFGKSIWTLKRQPDGRYDAQQKGFNDASGIGVLTGDRLRIDWKTGDGEFAGFTEMTLNEKRDAGKGKSVIKKDEDSTLPSTFKRLDQAPGAKDKCDLSGRWEALHEKGEKVIVTLKSRPDGQYDAEAANDGFGGKATGTGKLVGNVFQCEWTSPKNGWGGNLECTFDSTGNSGKFKIKVGFSTGGAATFSGQVSRVLDGPTQPMKNEGPLDEKSRGELFEKAMRSAKIFIERKEYAEAVRASQDALRYFPNDAGAREMLRQAEELAPREKK